MPSLLVDDVEISDLISIQTLNNVEKLTFAIDVY